MPSLFENYALLTEKINSLTEMRDLLKTKIINQLEDDKLEKLDTAVGKFTIAQLKTWTYSKKVTNLKEEFEAQKAHEESTGEATFVEKPSLRFTQIKL